MKRTRVMAARLSVVERFAVLGVLMKRSIGARVMVRVRTRFGIVWRDCIRERGVCIWSGLVAVCFVSGDGWGSLDNCFWLDGLTDILL